MKQPFKEIRQIMDAERKSVEATFELKEITEAEQEAATRAIEHIWGRIVMHFSVGDSIRVPNKQSQ